MAMRYKEFRRLSNGHSRGITSVSFSSEGNHIATGGLDGKICIWRLDDNKLLHSFSGQTAILSLIWIPGKENALLCGSQDGNVTVLTISEVRRAVYFTRRTNVFAVCAHREWVLGTQVSRRMYRRFRRLRCHGSSSRTHGMEMEERLYVPTWQFPIPAVLILAPLTGGSASLARRFHRFRDLPEPPSSSHNQHQEILVTSVHWTSGSATTPPMLVVSYMYHGIQWVFS